ncbi:hypothetical protein [Paludibacterium purpuratum]|uniref:Uncharacterized protein n=1 Tax=Paludibacterium purpuratum TaxID=1144873 RepID=A0A4R7B0Y2_9NEIS|nr:hypothetical protein [Paludibacterium purpuratum]TDR76572.1 hypothetical protein DFP86_111155 [Paludibacterium purpuratum]
MQALLRLGLFTSVLLVCIGMIRHARRPDSARLERVTLWLQRLTWTNGAVLLLWLFGLVRH